MTSDKASLIRLFMTYLRLGCIAFGGPVAHLGYFKETFVNRLKWLSEARFTELLSLCQFVPGPSSSQLGFAIGWHRAGVPGACAAWLGFTLPSALLMIGFAYGLIAIGESAQPIVQGLLIAAVAIVANAILGLGRKLCNDWPRRLITLGTALWMVATPGSYLQVVAILSGGGIGYLYYANKAPSNHSSEPAGHRSRGIALPAIILYVGLLILSFWIQAQAPGGLFALHYRAGALVFGGGHVVLPLLHDSIVSGGLVGESDFLAGYSAAQTLPGPLFTFSAFLGTAGSPIDPKWIGGIGALIAIFLPGMLLLLGLLPFWDRIRNQAWAQASLLGANAAVVGLLIAALIDPVISHGIRNGIDIAIAVAAFISLYRLKLPPWLVVSACGGIGYFIF